ncbi:hypothetical protein OB919_04045 [Halobacteria archaeon AArc-curdl1]|uniref:Uncharacterized protein n=1 Tax=Natronosalvus hydrolyticus TaxID=2979988 RepID=A0AAP2Z868_9EURY|nr:hypothetical protein [Halobacteria archaeon AArc-curdl1]
MDMNRRKALTKAITVCSITFGGCLSESSTDSHADHGSTRESQEGRVDSVFIENLSDTKVKVVVIIHNGDDDEGISNQYKIPERTGVEIPEVGIEGERYNVGVQYDRNLEAYEWSVQNSCIHESQSTELSIRINEDETLTVFAEGCDEKSTGIRAGIDYADHEKYII